MSVILSGQTLGKSYGFRPLFQNITFGVEENERLGLIGPNGSGKSTLLRILSGREKADSGIVSTRRGLKIGYVPQDEEFPDGATVDAVLRDALRQCGVDPDEHLLDLEVMLGKFAFPDKNQLASTLSGGWKKRLALASALIGEPEILLLDEPTNHLDLDGVLWLETLLKSAPFGFVLISHDRRFLENVVNRVIEISPSYPEGFLSVKGAYSDFLIKREEFLSAQAHLQHALEGKVKREIEWLRRGPPARTTKAQSRIRDAGKLMEEFAEVKHRNAQDQVAGIDFTASGRRSKDLLLAMDISKSMGGRVLFRNMDIVLTAGTKLGLLGSNGSGKTTLLRLLNKTLAPDTGRIKQATDLRVVWFDQNREQLDKQQSLRQALCPNGDTVIYQGIPIHVSSWAKRFLFRSEQLNVPLSVLSGGEQARILIARLMLQPADLLILDEPTNDLDIPSLEVLEDSLEEFKGAIVIVTHDRFMLDAIATEVLALDGAGGWHGYADYRQWERSKEPSTERVAPPRGAPTSGSPAPKSNRTISSSERRELAQMEARIESAEERVSSLQNMLEDPTVASNAVQLQECWNSLETAKQDVVLLYERWQVLEAKAAGG